MSLTKIETTSKLIDFPLLRHIMPSDGKNCALNRISRIIQNQPTFSLLELAQQSGRKALFLFVMGNYDKWKNHFYEMKGDVGMSLHEKGRNKKMPTPRPKVTHNPIPTHLFCFNMLFVCLFVCYECIRQSKQHILTCNCLRNMLCCGLGRNKDVGMGL